jgi:PD-(D/E)XK nuclease superfamily
MAPSLPIVTTSSRSLMKRCPQAWWWRYVDGYQSKGDSSPDALWFGIGVHNALAEWYQLGTRRGPHPADTFEKWVNGEIRFIKAAMAERDAEWYDEPKYEDAAELGVAMLEGYVDKWGDDERWYVLAVERPIKVRITNVGRPVAIFWSTWDGVFRDQLDGSIYLMEHKTASQIRTAYLELDDQAGSYYSVASTVLRADGTLKPKEDIEGIQYNFLRKAMPDDRPTNALGESLNKDGSVSKRQPTAAFVRPEPVLRSRGEVKSQMEALQKETEIAIKLLDGSIPVTKTPTKDCPNSCEFFDMCILHNRGGEAWKTLARSTFKKVDPFDRYRKSSGDS